MSDYESDYESDNGAVMHWFGQQDLGIKFGICLGILIILVVLLGCCKLIYNKHQLKKHAKAAETNQSEAKEELHVLNRREEEEGDLFGIRALEKGFYGGVAQSRPATPISTQSTLVPPRSVHDPSRPSSDTGYLKNSHAAGAGKDAVDMHLVVPPSPTFPRRNETRSPSPTGSSSSQANAPQLDMPTMPSTGLSIQTYSNRPTSPRTQTSQFSSVGGSSDRGVPTVTVSQSDHDRSHAHGSLHQHDNTHLVTSGLDTASDSKNRVSTASITELYDSYYHNRMSTMHEQPEERQIYPSFIAR